MNIKELSPKGFRELTPDSQAIFNRMIADLSTVYSSFGYQNIHTTAIEYLDVISGGDDTSKEIFSVGRSSSENTEAEDRTRALRFDLTKPFARYVVENYNELAFPFKRYQIQQSWRGERPQKGRYREFFQADIDVVANENLPLFYDSEVLEVSLIALEKLNIESYLVKINNRKLVQGVFNSYGIEDAKLPQYLRILDKVEKIGQENVTREFLNIGDLEEIQANELLSTLLNQKISLYEINTFLDKIQADNELIKAGISEIKQLVESLKNLELTKGEIILDTSIIRGLDYYTGFVFETVIKGYEQFGSILSGGRYDNLIGDISNKNLPGVGASIGLSRLFAVMEEIGLDKYRQENNSVLIANLDHNSLSDLRKISSEVRKLKNCEIYPQPVKLIKQIKYAEKKGYKQILIIEEDGSILLKNLENRDQESFTNVEQLINNLK